MDARSEGDLLKSPVISRAPTGGRAPAPSDRIAMRRLGFGISCALACGVFFGDVAPGKYDPAPSNLKSEVAVIPKTPIGTWTTTGNITAVNIEAVEPDDLSADVPSNDPNDLKRPTSFERAKAALAQFGATA